MKRIIYIASTFSGQKFEAYLDKKDFDNWDDVLKSKVIWGFMNYGNSSEIAIQRHDNFPDNVDRYFDKDKHLTYDRIKKIEKKIIITSIEPVWLSN